MVAPAPGAMEHSLCGPYLPVGGFVPCPGTWTVASWLLSQMVSDYLR